MNKFILCTDITVVFVMVLTSALLVLIMIMIWKTKLLIISYVLTIGSLELSSVLYKFKDKGYLPLSFPTLLMVIMYVWTKMHGRKYYFRIPGLSYVIPTWEGDRRLAHKLFQPALQDSVLS